MTKEEYKKIKKELDESTIDFPIVNEVLAIMKTHIKEQEPIEDCISRQAVLKLFATHDGKYLYEAIRDMPHLEPDNCGNYVVMQEPKTGHWNSIPKYPDIAWCCSGCKHFTTMKHRYCPNCGARMSEVEQ